MDYKTRRHNWVKKNRVLGGEWKLYERILVAIVSLVAALASGKKWTEMAWLGWAVFGIYLAVWGGEYLIKWIWHAPKALDNEREADAKNDKGQIQQLQSTILNTESAENRLVKIEKRKQEIFEAWERWRRYNTIAQLIEIGNGNDEKTINRILQENNETFRVQNVHLPRPVFTDLKEIVSTDNW